LLCEHSAPRKRSACEVSPACDASTRHAVSSTSLVVGASGLCTPGPVRLGGVHRLLALFLLRGIRRAAPAQVAACRVVTNSGAFTSFNERLWV